MHFLNLIFPADLTIFVLSTFPYWITKSLQTLILVNTIPVRTRQINTSWENSSVQTFEMIFLKRIMFIKNSTFLFTGIWNPLYILIMFFLLLYLNGSTMKSTLSNSFLTIFMMKVLFRSNKFKIFSCSEINSSLCFSMGNFTNSFTFLSMNSSF